jgi:carboxyl-terminal processing protease
MLPLFCAQGKSARRHSWAAQGIFNKGKTMPRFRLPGRQGLILTICLLVLVMMAAGCGQKAQIQEEVAPVLTSAEMQLNLESFDMVWTTIRDKHWDPELGGLDWDAVNTELRPRMVAATTMAEARSILNTLINRLEVSHFGIFPADLYDDVAATSDGEKAPSGDGYTGMEIRVRDGQTLVTRVWPDTPAADAGIVPGTEVLKVRSLDLRNRAAKLDSAITDKSSKRLMLSMAMQNRLKGKVGDSLPVTLRDAQDREVNVDLELIEAPGTMFTMGNLPAARVFHETRVLPNGAGYFGFNYFLGITEVMPAYNKAMASFKDTPGVVIDLRGNPGGLGAMAMGMSGWFIADKGHQLGVMTMRTGDLKFAINPRANGYTGPVAILTDEITASTSEIMAGGLQDLGRARLFGATSAGAALPSIIDKLPNGDGFQYAIANYISDGGQQLEGQGVTPDQPVPDGRKDWLKDGDPVLKAALAWIDSQQ